jgi:hypothetical protein
MPPEKNASFLAFVRLNFAFPCSFRKQGLFLEKQGMRDQHISRLNRP